MIWVTRMSLYIRKKRLASGKENKTQQHCPCMRKLYRRIYKAERFTEVKNSVELSDLISQVGG